MDKYEYKVRSEEIKALIAEGEYAKAVEIADTIDWRRVKSVMMLCTISDLYKINRRYQESKDILLMAYERHPDSRLIIYSLCELSIKLEEVVQAIEYYKEFVTVAPKDTGKYILQYRLYEAQDVTLEERIAVLEEFKKKDYREKWAYELAYLYHRIGLASKCVEECDEMYLWFGEGRYVTKAMELKKLHTSLTAEQEYKYTLWQNGASTANPYPVKDDDEEEALANTASGNEMDIQVKTVDVGKYNTVNLQRELAESMKEIMSTDENGMMSEEAGDSNVFGTDPNTGKMHALQWSHTQSIRLTDADFAPSEQDYAQEEPVYESQETYFSEETGEMQYTQQETYLEEEPVYYEQPVFVPQDPEPEKTLYADPAGYLASSIPTQVWNPEDVEKATIHIEDYISTQEAKQVVSLMKQDTASLQALAKMQEETVPGAKTGVLTPLNTGKNPFDQMLSQEYDGQIKLAVPDEDLIEKQITGQMSIDDVMAEWEKMKQDNEEKRKGEVRERILQHTGSLFDDFDEATKSGLLEQLEKAFVEAIMKEGGEVAAEEDLGEAIEKEAKLAADRIHSQMNIAEAQEEETSATESVPESAEVVEETAKDPVAEDDSEEEDGVEELEEISEEEDASEETDEAVRMVQKELEDQEEETRQKKAEMKKKGAEKKAQKPAGQRELTDEEKKIFSAILKHAKSREQLLFALDNISMAACTGNVVITGEDSSDNIQLAKDLINEVKQTDSNFLGQVAKIEGKKLNNKDMAALIEQLKGGALIVEKASGLNDETTEKLVKALNTESTGIIVFLEDTKRRMNAFLSGAEGMEERFNVRIDVEAPDVKALVEYAQEYAEEQEYCIDAMAIMALTLRIENLQTIDHEVTMAEVRDLVDEAIYYADKKTPKHFMDIMLGKRYGKDDMIVLREDDFMHNS